MRQVILNTILKTLTSGMNLSCRTVCLVRDENISMFHIIHFLDYPSESGVIHLINTNQEAGLTSADFMLVHQQLYRLHQISFLLDRIRLPERRVVFMTIMSNNGHGNHYYYVEVKLI